MARWWKEPLDPEKHIDHFRSYPGMTVPPEPLTNNLQVRWVYFVHVCSFTFEFASLEQIRATITYFAQGLLPSNRRPTTPHEHYWQRWHERLPTRLFKRSKLLKSRFCAPRNGGAFCG